MSRRVPENKFFDSLPIKQYQLKYSYIFYYFQTPMNAEKIFENKHSQFLLFSNILTIEPYMLNVVIFSNLSNLLSLLLIPPLVPQRTLNYKL